MHKISVRKFVFCSVLVLCFSNVFSQTGGSNTYEFLNLPAGSHIASLGGTNVSHFSTDPVFVNSNPALLTTDMNEKLSLNYINYLSDINFGYISYSKNFVDIGMFGFGMQYVNYGKFIHSDETGQILGDFSAAEYSFNVYYSYKLNKKFNAGISMKTIYSNFWQYFSSGLAFDMGLVYNDTAKLISSGLVIKNAGMQIKPYIKGNREPLPFDVQIGITKKFRHAPLRFSITAKNLLRWDLYYKSSILPNYLYNDTSQSESKFFDKVGKIGDELLRHIVLGVEIVPSDVIYFGFGYNYRRRSEMVIPTAPKLTGFSAGFGISLSKFNIGYSISSYHLAGLSSHFNFCLNLGQFYRKN